jgi:hypothetical protein
VKRKKYVCENVSQQEANDDKIRAIGGLETQENAHPFFF